MATLTETAYILRKAILFGGIGFVIVVIATILIVPVINNRPDPEEVIPTPTPQSLFGPIPPPSFPASAPRPEIFSLETIAGGPPVSTSSAVVYFVPNKAPNLFSRKKAVEFASKFGFSEDYTELDERTFKFVDTDTNETLVVTVTNNNFDYTNNFVDPSVLQNTAIPDEQSIISKAKSYFQEYQKWDAALDNSQITYLAFEGSTLVPVERPYDAQAVRVDFLPNKIGDLVARSAQMDGSSVHVTFALDRNKILQIFESSYQYYPYDANTSSTYPTISGDRAWEILNGGGGHVSKPVRMGDRAVVREGYLAYLLPLGYEPYLQPVYVFEGDDGFIAIVPALEPLTSNNNSTNPETSPALEQN